MTPAQLRRIRWAVRGVLLLGVAASVTANVLHARDTPVAQAIAAWPPLALLLTVELIARVPVHRRALAAVRFFATALIAGIAAWVSYTHMLGVAQRYGEVGAAPYLIPLSVDGLVVVASVCLVELAGRIRDTAPTAPNDALGAEAGRPVLPPVDPAPVLVEPGPPAGGLPTTIVEVADAPNVEVREPDKSVAARRTSAPRRPFAVTQRAAAAMAADGMEPAAIAEALGISLRQVRTALRPVPVSRNP